MNTSIILISQECMNWLLMNFFKKSLKFAFWLLWKPNHNNYLNIIVVLSKHSEVSFFKYSVSHDTKQSITLQPSSVIQHVESADWRLFVWVDHRHSDFTHWVVKLFFFFFPLRFSGMWVSFLYSKYRPFPDEPLLLACQLQCCYVFKFYLCLSQQLLTLSSKV